MRYEVGPAWPDAYAGGRLELPVGILAIVVIVIVRWWRQPCRSIRSHRFSRRCRRLSRCIRPEAVGQEAAAHPAGHRKQTKA